MTTSQELNGVVEFFNNTKGWGVIKGEDGLSYFVHHKNITDKKFYPDNKATKFRTLRSGQSVIFSRIETDKQMNAAVNVRLGS